MVLTHKLHRLIEFFLVDLSMFHTVYSWLGLGGRVEETRSLTFIVITGKWGGGG